MLLRVNRPICIARCYGYVAKGMSNLLRHECPEMAGCCPPDEKTHVRFDCFAADPNGQQQTYCGRSLEQIVTSGLLQALYSDLNTFH